MCFPNVRKTYFCAEKGILLRLIGQTACRLNDKPIYNSRSHFGSVGTGTEASGIPVTSITAFARKSTISQIDAKHGIWQALFLASLHADNISKFLLQMIFPISMYSLGSYRKGAIISVNVRIFKYRQRVDGLQKVSHTLS